MVRRFAYAILLVRLSEFNRLQTQIILLLNLFAAIFQGSVCPFFKPLDNRIEQINEAQVMLSTCFLIISSNFVVNPDDRYIMGWVNIGFFTLLIGFNVTIIVFKHVYNL